MELLLYFVLTFAVTWAAWLGPTALGSTELLSGTGGLLFLLGVFAPGVVALGLTALHQGRAGVARLLAPLGHWRVGAGWYVFAIFYMAAVKLVAAAVHRLFTGVWPQFGATPWILMFAGTVAFLWTQAGEELGWRGYALPRLGKGIGFGAGSLVLGIVWAVWHLPLFFLPGSGSDGQSFPLYLSHVTGLSVTMAWVYRKTGGSLLLMMLMHAAINNTSGIVPAAVPGATDPFAFSASLMGWLTVAITWLLALPLLVRMRSARTHGGD